ncbi:HK97 gp10 family phage protein [Castellaniella hirudinis]|uniref:HK97 gp10 family phage protein n=1 Tax=Castellaniella hirudinis TaxID=1144617 RepID=UPI0039C1C108
MADAGIKFDFQEAYDRLDGLAEIAKQHLPRSMAVAAGQVYRDEAKARAPIYDQSESLMAAGVEFTRPRIPGTLRDAIYLAYSESRSAPQIGMAVYSVTWNATKAPHGHLVEFGHMGTNKLIKDKDGKYIPTNAKLPKPVRVPATPFLRPAYDAVGTAAGAAAMDRGRIRLAEILANPAILDQYK